MVNLELWKSRKKKLKLSLQDISDKTDISISAIKDIFRGATTDPRIETVQRIERVLELPQADVPRETDPCLLKPVKLNISPGELEQERGLSQQDFIKLSSKLSPESIADISTFTDEEMKELSDLIKIIKLKREL